MVLIKRLLAVLVLIAVQGCSEENYLQVALHPDYLPIFWVSEDEDFQSYGSITSLRVYVRGDEPLEDRTYWYIEVPYRGPHHPPGNRTQTPVKLSRIIYSVVPQGFNEKLTPRQLESGVEYCVTISGHPESEDLIECFIYRP